MLDREDVFANGDMSPLRVDVSDQVIEASESVGDPVSSLPEKFRQSVRLKTRSLSVRDSLFGSVAWAAGTSRLDFTDFGFGFDVRTKGVSYEILSAPEFSRGPEPKTMVCSARVRFTVKLSEDVRTETVMRVAVMIAYNPDLYGDGLVSDQQVVVESGAVYDGGSVEELRGIEARDALCNDLRFAIVADEVLRMFVRCDNRVYTPFYVRKSTVAKMTGLRLPLYV